MILDNTSTKLEGVLSGAADPAPVFHVGYRVYGLDGELSNPALSRGALNGATDVTLLSAPDSQGEVKEVLWASIYNADNAAITVTVKTDDGTTERTVIGATLQTVQTLHYQLGRGWYTTDANGEILTA